MPIRIPDLLPAGKILKQENIFVMGEKRAVTQDIRAIKIVVLNLMPIKQDTEVQLLRLLGNTPLQVDITLLRPESHQSKNTSKQYLKEFYKTFKEIKMQNFDGMIITGAPVECMPFEEVSYWDELKDIMEWTKTHVTSTFHICWGAQAGLYYHYGIDKHLLPKKMFGIFEHTINEFDHMVTGLDDYVYIPHSRHTDVPVEPILANPELKLILHSEEAGAGLVISKDGKNVFSFGHAEYDADTLDREYKRDLKNNLPIDMPLNYYRQDSVEQGINVRWRSHAYLLYFNWLNYYVYQVTPYNLETLS